MNVSATGGHVFVLHRGDVFVLHRGDVSLTPAPSAPHAVPSGELPPALSMPQSSTNT